jgi:hypothetical protein
MAGCCMVIDNRICEDTGALRGRGSARVGLCKEGGLRGRGSVRVGFCKGGGWWSSAVDTYIRGEDAGVRGGDALL